VADISSLHQEVRDLVRSGFGLEEILPLVTVHPARRLGIDRIKGRIEVGLDADLVLLDEELNVDWVMARGRVMVADGRVRVKGTFET
jgi:beta-aspartyl-dipeptidase (metallo-type)